MADHPINILLRARDQASKQIKGVNKELGLLGRTSRGLKTLGKVGMVGVAAGAGVATLAIRSGLESLAEREDVVSATAQAIKATGNAAQVSAGQIRTWSEAIETATGAAVDDKAVQAGANTLLRYKAVSGDTFRRALETATDLGAGLKSGPEAGAKMLGKALADPVKGLTALRRAGIVLTKEEEARIKQLVKGGKQHKAQIAILEAVEARYKGAAAASAGPYSRALNTMADASEDAKMALAEGFLPVIERLAGKLQTALADPATVQSLKDIGEGLADAADSAIDFVSGLPWDDIKEGLGKAAGFAKTLVGAFTSLPPEAQATILALAGLDKLSGGAVSGIVGELGKGLIKGVLGMTAGVVNLKAGVVNGGGTGVTGTGGKTGGKPGGLPLITPGVAGLGVAMATSIAGDTPQATRTDAQILAELRRIRAQGGGNWEWTGGETVNEVLARMDPTGAEWTAEQKATTSAVGKVKTVQDQSLVAFRAGERTSANGLSTVASTTRTGAAMTAMANALAASRIVSAIASNRPQVAISIYATGVKANYGTSTGSAGGGTPGNRGNID